MKKKILFVCNTSWGIYNFRLGIIKHLIDFGYDIYACAPKDVTTDMLVSEGVFVSIVPMDNRGTSPVNDVKLLIALVKIYKRIQPDLIFHYTIKPNIYGSIAAKLLGIKSIAFVTGTGYAFAKRRGLSRIVGVLFKVAFRFPEKIWFLNKDDADVFVRRGIVSRSNLELLPGEGINTNLFKPDDRVVHPENFSFLFFGRLLWDKGIYEFVESARMIRSLNKDVQFNILGFIDREDSRSVSRIDLEKWANEGTVNYLGGTNDVRKFILQSDCVVLPSYYEGLPRTLLEASSLERPIITTDIGGCKEVVDDERSGFLVHVRDIKDLTDKMRKMMNLSIAERKQMGRRGREKVIKEFDEKIIVDKYLLTLNEIFHS